MQREAIFREMKLRRNDVKPFETSTLPWQGGLGADR